MLNAQSSYVLRLSRLTNLSIITIGVCSYLLIGYWSHRLAAVKSAQKAILVNRVSDGMLLWGVLWVWYNTGTLEYDLILLNAAPASSTFLGVAILIGAMGKSAQILFHVWLADAMEGSRLKYP
jgi:NADH:ubiquinone oxidoreductase subunit 5 (subunit L)/multisubunit Na+/H+ antiporter MnhA subunit